MNSHFPIKIEKNVFSKNIAKYITLYAEVIPNDACLFRTESRLYSKQRNQRYVYVIKMVTPEWWEGNN